MRTIRIKVTEEIYQQCDEDLPRLNEWYGSNRTMNEFLSALIATAPMNRDVIAALGLPLNNPDPRI